MGVGLQVNMDKTKYMTVATTQGDVSVPGLSSLQQVDDFKYLGSIMASSQAVIAIWKSDEENLVLNGVATASQGRHISFNLSFDPAV